MAAVQVAVTGEFTDPGSGQVVRAGITVLVNVPDEPAAREAILPPPPPLPSRRRWLGRD
jgi:hypothetical protein